MRQCDDWISDYLRYTENTEPRESYRTWVAISTVAAALQRRCWVNLGSETWYPNFYIVLVGPPAARKGTAIKPAVGLMDAVGILSAPEEPTRQALIDELVHSLNTFEDEGNIYSFCGITIISPELTVFLKRGDEAMFSTLCDWFDCLPRFRYKTVARKLEEITNVWVNLLGATTPATLQLSLPTEAFGGGLVSRSIFVYEDNKKLPIVIWPTLDKTLEPKLKHDLEDMRTISGQFRFEDGDKFIEEYTRFRVLTEEHPPIREPRLVKYNDRRPMHLIKLSMIMSAARSSSRIITIDDFRRALSVLERAERRMPDAFRGVGQNPLSGIQAQIMAMIKLKKRVHRKALMNTFYEDITSTQLSEIISTLINIGFCEFESMDSNYLLYKEDYE